MAKRLNNKILIIVFLVLVIIVAAVWIYDSRQGERSFRSELFEMDPAEVTAISIFPAGEEIRLTKDGEAWMVISGAESYPADTAFVSNLLQTFLDAKPERVAGLDRNSWAEFQVTDTTGTRVVIEEQGDVIADVRVGKVSFSQPPQNQGYQRSQNPIIKSHVRVAGDEKVYLVDGFLSLMFNEDPSYYRDKIICRFGEDQPVRFTCTYPGDTSFTLARSAGGWLVNELPADSMEVVSFLRSISNTMGNEFATAEEIPGITYTHHVKIEGNNMPVVDLEGMKVDPANLYYIRSSANPSAVFRFTNPSVFQKIFVSREKFK